MHSKLRHILRTVKDEMLVVHSAQFDSPDHQASQGRPAGPNSLMPRRKSSGQVYRSIQDMKYGEATPDDNSGIP